MNLVSAAASTDMPDSTIDQGTETAVEAATGLAPESTTEPTTPRNGADFQQEDDVVPKEEDDSKKSKPGEKRRYHCTFAGCNRDYSRAEHLYRHQLNHNPKEIFRCHYPQCTRTFVRQDLCSRHQERHFSRGRQESAPPDAAHLPVSTMTGHSSDTDEISALVALGASNVSAYNRARTLPATDSYSSNPTYTQNNQSATSSRYPNILNGPSQQSSAMDYTAYRSNSFQKPTDYSESYERSSVFTKPLEPSSISSKKRSHDLVDLSVTATPYLGRRSTDASLNGLDMGTNSGGAALNESPVSMRDEFTNWLFDDMSGIPGAFTGLGVGFMNSTDGFGNQIYPAYFDDGQAGNAYQNTSPTSAGEMTGQTPSATDQLLSPAKRQKLINLIESRFTQDDANDLRQLREAVLDGDRDQDDHALSMRSLQNYIGSYWFHFHEQIPILHQPTFSADQTHPYLLLAIMAIGASKLNKAHGRAVADGGTQFAAFMAWHLRWLVFKDPDFRPPAKLWVFQTLLLLETYEKMSASRLLHERAHIHSPTTITLMRRGTALIDDHAHREISRHATTPEQWWARWIQAEATRRVALAAFYLDALSATSFGHAAIMVPHEIRLPLPCDDALWEATSAAEVARVEASLHANGVQPPTFTDALRKILTGRKVRTNPLGRMILMAGLLSISWHMQQRDLQTSVLGVSRGMGMGTPPGWREPLAKSFDFWKKDFEDSRAHMQRIALPWQTSTQSTATDNDTSITATVFWHLAHMAMHVDIRDIQIFAGAKSNLGRPVADTDRERAKNTVASWIRSAGGRTAIWHALQLLRDTLIRSPVSDTDNIGYNARDDHLTYRSWALYTAGLIVFCWGFMADGILRPFPTHFLKSDSGGQVAPLSAYSAPIHRDSSKWDDDAPMRLQNLQDAKLYLETIGSMRDSAELEAVKTGRNNIVGLLRTLEFAFKDARWDLLREGAERLKAAICMLEGR